MLKSRSSFYSWYDHKVVVPDFGELEQFALIHYKIHLCLNKGKETSATIYHIDTIRTKSSITCKPCYYIYTVPTPFFFSSLLLAASSPLSLSLPALRLNAFHSSAKKSFPFFSVMRFFNHSFCVCSCPIFCSKCAVLSFSSFAAFSRACSRCFFFTRKRADAAVLRRRLSSSAAWRDDSSWPTAEPVETALAIRLLPGAGEG